MITGIGTDIVNIARIEKIYQKFSTRFLQKILSESEYKNFFNLPEHKKLPFLAKRFAAKEAVAKAVGTGISDGLRFQDISIENLETGKPYIRINGIKADEFSSKTFHISISDDYPFAIAFVVISN